MAVDLDGIEAQLKVVQVALDKRRRDDTAQAELTHAIKKLEIVAEGPALYAATLGFEPVNVVCLYIASEKGLIEAIASRKGASVTAETLAKETSLDKRFITRILRILVTIGICENPDEYTYASNAVTECLNTPSEKEGINFHAVLLWPLVGDIAKYVQEAGIHQFPTSRDEKIPFHYHFGGPIWEVLQSNDELKEVYDAHMNSRKHGLDQSWYNIFPAAEGFSEALSSASATPERPLLVDVGGGRGQDTARFLKTNPGKYDDQHFILQDLPETLSKVKGLPSNIELQVHDFFTPQPVKGAWFYLFHNIVHDFSDEKALALLKNTAKALGKHSRVLIHEFVLRDRYAQRRGSLIDLTMFMHAAGVERSESEFRQLLGEAGLEIVKIWTSSGEGEAVIEARAKAA